MKFLKNGMVTEMVLGSKMYEREGGRRERERERRERERYTVMISVYPFHCVQVFVPLEC